MSQTGMQRLTFLQREVEPGAAADDVLLAWSSLGRHAGDPSAGGRVARIREARELMGGAV